jgi:hypothetical protein
MRAEREGYRVDVAVSGGSKEPGERRRVDANRLCAGGRHRSDEVAPTGDAEFPRKCVLHLAEPGGGRDRSDGAGEPGAGASVTDTKRLQPTLRFPLEVVNGGGGRDTPGHDPSPVVPDVR